MALLGAAISPPGPARAESGTPDAATSEVAAPTGEATRREDSLLFPRDELFEPLVADLNWPRFSVEHQWRFGNDEFSRVAAVSFGESFAFVRSPQYDWGEWEFGMQAMADAILDLTKQSCDLSNEDYFIGFTGSVRTRGVTVQLRLYHISSHLGDEYLLENGVERGEVSFESIDLLASFEPRKWLRVYGGGGVLLNPSPAYDPIVTQFGLEVTSPVSFASGFLTPISGTDLKLRQENDWIPEVAVLAGLRLARPTDSVRHIDLYTRYYHGRSPDGQFFDRTIDSLGLGLRLGF